MESFRGKVVVVTGASSGIGAETAVQFASKGAKVTLTGRHKERLNDTLHKCLSAGATDQDILMVHGDITENHLIQLIVDETVGKFGQIDVLVNNAGITMLGSLSDVNEDDLLWIHKVDVMSVVLLTQKAMPYLLKTKGNVVNVSSVAACQPIPAALGYSMSKAALDMFTKCTALQYAGKGVRVNAVNPGVIETPILATSGICKNDPDELRKRFERLGPAHPMQRGGFVHEVAAAILYLASDQASFTTGATFPVDGGRYCWMQGVPLLSKY